MRTRDDQTIIQTKLDVLDFIISVLREHERILDNVVERLEMLCDEQENRLLREKLLLASLSSNKKKK
jgi:hypothetical protein